MRVLFFVQTYNSHVFRFLSELAHTRHEIIFIRLQSRTPVSERRPLPIGIREVLFDAPAAPIAKPDDWLHLVPQFEQLVAKINPDLIHAGPIQSCGYIAAHSKFSPLMVMSWGSDILLDADRNGDWRGATQFTLDKALWFQCDCNAVRDSVRTFRRFPKEQIVQFPWGVDLEHFTPGPDTLRLRFSPGWIDSIIVLSNRSWEPIYDIGSVLESFRLAQLAEPSLRLVLMGDGSLAGLVSEFLRIHQLQSKVLLPGWISNDEIPRWHRAVDIYLSCATVDGASVSLLEAFASGLPAVATDNPSNREWIATDENGDVASAGDPGAFAAALLRISQLGPVRRKEMGIGNRRVAERRANWLANFPQLLEAYDRIEAAYAH